MSFAAVNAAGVPQAGTNNFVRDIGIMASAKYGTKISGLPLGGTLQTTVINGKGRNAADVNDSKDWVGRLTIQPFLAGLSIGGQSLTHWLSPTLA